MDFKLKAPFEPMGDQPTAINDLVEGLNSGERDQVLLGVTGSGKTFTVANVIERTQRPSLILCHNKTLAAQLYGEMKNSFLKMLWNTSLVTTIIINRRPMYLLQDCTLKKT